MITVSLREKRIVLGAFLLCLILIGVLAVRLSDVQQELDDTNAEIARRNSLLQNEIDYQKSLLRPAVDAENNQIIIPEAGITLPFNDITKTFQYTYDDGEYGYLRVTSTLISDRADRQMSCSELALVNFRNGEPLNPWTESAGSVELSDGRTMFIISPIAFENNEASTLACESEVWTMITPTQIANELKKAEPLQSSS